MHRLSIYESPLEAVTHEILTDDVIESLTQHYAQFPAHARLYCGQPSRDTDVTPKNEEDIKELASMEGDFTVIEYPGVDWIYYAYALVAVLAVVAISSAKKAIPVVASRNETATSPNNALSARSNQARVNGRIPDIFGTLQSTPDLLMVPYSVFKNHIEFEYTYMCIGRGSYYVPSNLIKDGQTVVSAIEGERVEIWGPGTSPNYKGPFGTLDPQVTVGGVNSDATIDRAVILSVRSKSVNGQVLQADNEVTTNTDLSNLVGFVYPNKIQAISSNPFVFTGLVGTGDTITIQTSQVGIVNQAFDEYLNGSFSMRFHSDGHIEFQTLSDIGTDPHLVLYFEIEGPPVNISGVPYNFGGKYQASSASGANIFIHDPEKTTDSWLNIGGSPTAWVTYTFASTPDYASPNVRVDFSGEYHVLSATDKALTLDNPGFINGSWAWMYGNDLNGGDESFGFDGAKVLLSVGNIGNWVGPFVLDITTTDEIICNFVALQGMYKDDGVIQSTTNVDIQIGVTPCDTSGNPLGAELYYSTTVEGSADVKSTRASTLFADLPKTGRYMVRARRLTLKDTTFPGTVVDEVKWRDLYSSSPVGNIAFGNVTTVYALTQATADALAVAERQLNMIVTRLVTVPGNPDPQPSNFVSDIITAVCNDPKIGNKLSGIDFDQDNFYDVGAAIKSYFGFDEAADFSYTFDSELTFEETLNMIAEAVFCTAHRRGRLIELSFEKETPDSVLLFNHRNKVPKSETRTVTFGGNVDGKDGIEFDYVSPIDDAIVTFYVPEDRTATNPTQIESVGIRNDKQAYLAAYRAYNKLLYQNTATEFQATQEVEVVAVGDRVLVTDNTRPDVQDGEIVAQDGLTLTLSQPAVITFGVDFVIYLQHVSGYVESIPIIGTSDPYKVTLSQAPAETLSLLESASVKTLYQIVKEDILDTKFEQAFMVSDKNPQDNFITKVTCINYDKRYYRNDLDFA